MRGSSTAQRCAEGNGCRYKHALQVRLFRHSGVTAEERQRPEREGVWRPLGSVHSCGSVQGRTSQRLGLSTKRAKRRWHRRSLRPCTREMVRGRETAAQWQPRSGVPHSLRPLGLTQLVCLGYGQPAAKETHHRQDTLQHGRCTTRSLLLMQSAPAGGVNGRRCERRRAPSTTRRYMPSMKSYSIIVVVAAPIHICSYPPSSLETSTGWDAQGSSPSPLLRSSFEPPSRITTDRSSLPIGNESRVCAIVRAYAVLHYCTRDAADAPRPKNVFLRGGLTFVKPLPPCMHASPARVRSAAVCVLAEAGGRSPNTC
jgi:hypothetical protein